MQKQHSNRKHALLAPSSAGRWLACTPSARREAEYDDTTNDAADEGTFAHEVSELVLRNMLGLIPKVKFNSELKRLKHNRFWSAELYGHAQDYVTYILDKYDMYSERMISIEEEIDLACYAPDSFGHLDLSIVGYDKRVKKYVLDINDLKYGKGVLVEAEDNSQLKLYALGALEKYLLIYPVKLVRMSIYQPRLENYETFEMTADDLLKWGKNYVIPRAKDAFAGKGEYSPNPGKQCKFCKARYNCKALMNYALDVAKYSFEDAEKLNDDDVSRILEIGPDIVTWINSVKEYALEQSTKNHKAWPNFKLVYGRANRKYQDTQKIIKVLEKAKIKKSLYMTDPQPQLVNITTLEKNLGKDKVAKFCSKYIIKPEGAPALVPNWDKRQAIGSASHAIDAFKDVNV